MTRLKQGDEGYEQAIKDAEYLTNEHSQHTFGKPTSSMQVDNLGEPLDISFRTQSGKVAYDLIDGTEDQYLVSFRHETGDPEPTIEKRIMSLEKLSGWFYDPTDKYYDEVVLPIALEE